MSTSTAPSALLSVDALSVRYRGSSRRALDEVTFRIAPGETVALVGESGSGKSTLANALIGLLPHTAAVEGGEILLEDSVLPPFDDRAWRGIRGRRIALIPQDPSASLNPLSTVGAQVAEALILHRGRSRHEARLETIEALERVGIDSAQARARQLPHQLSGGMQQRVLIAMALASEPDLIVADEPTSALDVTVQKTVLDTLEALTGSAGTAVVLITHDIGVAVDRAQRIVVLHDGRIVEDGQADRVSAQPSAVYTRELIFAAPSLTSARLVSDKTPEPAVASTVIVENLSRSFPLPDRTKIVAAQDIAFRIGEGRTLALVGESGSGKTTVSRIVAGAEQADTGIVVVDDLDVTSIHRDRLRQVGKKTQLVHQHPGTAMDPRWTVAKIISEALVDVLPRQDRPQRVRELLDSVALAPDVAERTAAHLSGGQRQRVALARALARRPRVLILDEPVSALDVLVQSQVLNLLADLQREQGISYLFISHDLAVVRQIAHDVVVMRKGLIVETGPVLDVFNHPQHEYTRALLEAIPGRRYAKNTASPSEP